MRKQEDVVEEGLVRTWKLVLVKKQTGGLQKGKEVLAVWQWHCELGWHREYRLSGSRADGASLGCVGWARHLGQNSGVSTQPREGGP